MIITEPIRKCQYFVLKQNEIFLTLSENTFPLVKPLMGSSGETQGLSVLSPTTQWKPWCITWILPSCHRMNTCVL